MGRPFPIREKGEKRMLAGSLEISFLTNLAKLKSDMDQADRSVGAATTSMSRNLTTYEKNMGELGRTSARSATAIRAVALQLPDVTSGLLTGQKPMTIFIQQGLQIFQVAQLAEGGVKGFAAEIGMFALRFAPLIAIVAVATGGIALFKSEMSDDKGLKEYANSLGLTHKEMKKLGDVSVTVGDVIKGTWTTLVNALDLSGPLGSAKKLLSEAAAWAVTIFKTVSAGVYALFVGGYRAIVATWRQWPAVLGDLFVRAINGAAAAIEFLLNKSIDGINAMTAGANKLTGINLFGTVDHASIARMQNNYASDAADAGKGAAQAFSGAYTEGLKGIEGVSSSLFKNINAAARERVKELADKIIDDRTAKAAKAAKQQKDVEGQIDRDRLAAMGEQAKALDALMERMAEPLKIDMGPVKAFLNSYVDGLDEAKLAAQAASDELQKWAEASDRMHETANGIANAWGKVGRSVADAIDVLAEYGVRQAQIDKDVAAGTKTQSQGMRASADLQLNSLIGITDAAKGLFSAHSKGYKAMAAAEKALTIIQLARTAVDVAGGAARMFASLGPLAFPAVGAMLAVMASLGFSGGGSGGSAPRSNEGKGTTLGDSGATSDSLKKSIDLLSDIDKMTMTYSAQMAASLKAIENNIGGLATLLVRTGNITGATDGIQTGFKSSLSNAMIMSVGGPLSVLLSPVLKQIPIIGDILGGLQGVVKSLFGTKTSVVGSGVYGGAQSLSSVMNGGFDLQTYADIQKKKKFLGVTTGSKYSTQYGAADAQVADQFGLILKSFYDAIGAAAVPLGKSTAEVESQLDGFVVNLGKIDFTGLSGDEIQKKLEAVFGAAADSMASAAFPGIEKFQKVGEGAFETLTRVASTVEAVTTGLQMLGLSTKSLGVDASMSIAGLFDSVDAMNSATQSYFTTFYSAEEQAAVKTAQLTAAFGSLGLALPDSIANYRKLVDAQDLTTAAGQNAYAALIQLAPAFAAVASGAQDATSAAAIIRERQDLEKELMQLQGDTTALRKAELDALNPANRALKEQIYALTDQAAATEAATQAAQAEAAAQKAIADERAGIERQILDLQSNTDALRALDLNKLDASNRALMLQVYALQDQATATAAAAQAASDAAATENAIADERAGLQRQMLELQGDTAALRALDLAGINDSNKALQLAVWAEQDRQAAMAASQQAADAAAQAAEQLRDAWMSIADSIYDEVKRIRGLNSTGTDSYASLLSQFNQATSQARAGDQDAAKNLPTLSKALLDLAANVATSQQELTRIQSVTANSLQDTAALISAGAFSANDNSSVPQPWTGSAADMTVTATNGSADLVAEIRSLRAEVASLREDQRTGTAQMVGQVKRGSDVLVNVSQATGGDRFATKEIAA